MQGEREWTLVAKSCHQTRALWASVLFPPLVYAHVARIAVSGLTVSPRLNSLHNYIIMEGLSKEWTNISGGKTSSNWYTTLST